jgi:hypothetical protein
MNTALRAAALVTVAASAAPFAILTLPGCAEHATPTLTPAQKKKAAAAIVTEAKPAVSVGAVIEDQVRLIGYDIDKTTVAPGQSFTVTYYLEALAQPMGDNSIFVHFQGKKNDRKAWMNLDHHPVEGLLPLRQLEKGQIVKDVQRVTVPADFTAGEAKLYWGLWRGEYRLKIKNPEAVPHDDEGRVVLATVQVKGARPTLPQATALRIADDALVTVDGKLDEAAWTTATWTPKWTHPNGTDAAAPDAQAAFLWTPTTLFVGVRATDTDIWTDFTERDSNTWEQEVIELFIDADGDKKDYLELQVTPANVVFDARFEAHRSDLAKARAWNMAGLRTAVAVDGTLNARDDEDKGFTLEMAIPVAEVPGAPHTPRRRWRRLARQPFPVGLPEGWPAAALRLLAPDRARLPRPRPLRAPRLRRSGRAAARFRSPVRGPHGSPKHTRTRIRRGGERSGAVVRRIATSAFIGEKVRRI